MGPALAPQIPTRSLSELSSLLIATQSSPGASWLSVVASTSLATTSLLFLLFSCAYILLSFLSLFASTFCLSLSFILLHHDR